jgi:NitT/TauT family transport system ATP-binding protein
MDSGFKKLVDSVMRNLVSMPVSQPPNHRTPGAGEGPRRASQGPVTSTLFPPPAATGLLTPTAQENPPPQPAKPAVIELVNVSKSFTTGEGELISVLDNISLRLEKPGEFVVLLGPSGCGKSTILSLISGLALPEAGEVRIFGETNTETGTQSATVPQAYTCYPWLTALQNVEFGLALQGSMSKSDMRDVAMEYLKKVGLGDRAHARPRELSGGMQQRVAIARTLAVKRPIVLMDEPFGALDAQTREEMQQMLLQLWDEEKNTIVFVTHDITEALLLADRVIVFPPRPVRKLTEIVLPFPYDRPPDIVQQPEFMQWCAYLRQFLKRNEHAFLPEPTVRKVEGTVDADATLG